MLRLGPFQLASVGAGADPAREQHPFLEQSAQGLQRRAGLLEGREHEPERRLHLSIGVELEATIGSIDQTDRRRERQVAATGLVEEATAQASLEDVQLGLAHRPLQAKQKSVVEVSSRS